MRWLLASLVTLLLVLQYRLWIAEGSLAEQHRLEQQVREQSAVNARLEERNAVLERDVLELQNGNDSVEERAREELGLIREGEVFYQFVDGDSHPAGDNSSDNSSDDNNGGTDKPAATAPESAGPPDIGATGGGGGEDEPGNPTGARQ